MSDQAWRDYLWRDYLSVRSLRAMAPNDPIDPPTVLKLAESHEKLRLALEQILESSSCNDPFLQKIATDALDALEDP